MNELKKIKKELSKKTIDMTWQEMKKWLDEGKEKWDADIRKIRENKEKQKI